MPGLRFHRRHWMYLVFGALGLLAGLLGHAASGAERVNVGIVVDGDGPLLQEAVGLFTSEITELIAGEFDVHFDDAMILTGDWSVEGVEDAMRALQGSADVDVVLALGFVSSTVAARMPEHPKPTFAPMALASDVADLPRSGRSSGVTNLNYLAAEVRFADDLQTFREIVRFRKVALLMEKSIGEAVPELADRAGELAADHGVELVFILQESPTDDIVARIPGDAEAVMLGPLPRMDRAGRTRLIEGLAARGLPSYSLIGTTPVQRGVLAAAAPDTDWTRLARRNALNFQAVLLGENAGDQGVSFRPKRRLTINMETAGKLGISPRFDVLSTATLLNEDAVSEGRRWGLSSVAKEALQANLNIRTGMAGLVADAEGEVVARSRLRPQVGTSLGVTQLNDDAASVMAGGSAERTSTVQLQASQLLYSESAQAAVEVEHHRQQARVAAQRALELDVVQSATTAFLQVLKGQTAVDIRRRALELARTNLDLARDRVQLGSSSASDVYRWESEVASARRALLTTRASREQAMDALNRLLHRPIKERFSTEPASLTDPSLLVSRSNLVSLIDNQRAVDAMGEIFLAEGLANAPELRIIAANVAATERQVQSSRRSYWSPELSLSGQVGRVLGEHGRAMGSAEGRNDWRVTLNLSLPLFLGGRRQSDIDRGVYTLHELKLQRLAEQHRIEHDVRSGLHAVQASYAAIDLAARAADAARRNFALIQDGYNAGTVSIIGFLDARDAFLDADRAATDAVYDFLIDLMSLQRATGAFDFFLDAESMDAMAERIRQKVIGGS